MRRLDFAGKLVVVTGASSGLGREIARRLAYREKANLAIAARRVQRLDELKQEIESRCPSRVHVLRADLADPGGPGALFRDATALGEVFALVCSAGVTFWGKTLDASAETCDEIEKVNFSGTRKAAALFLEYFLARGRGALLAVTSVTAFVAVPFQNMYAATKHALQAFMEGLAGEYAGRDIVISTFVAGGMVTEMTMKAGLENPANMDPVRAARIAVEGFKRGKLRIVPGLLYKAAMIAIRLAPRAAVSSVVRRIYRPPRGRS